MNKQVIPLSAQSYKVGQEKIGVLTGLDSARIAIPELQRPFVWKGSQVRDLLDSLYKGFPIGFLITWRNAAAPLKDGTPSALNHILIDGQQRVVGLRSALLGESVLNKQFKRVRIKIAFHPEQCTFEVYNAAIGKSRQWIHDISDIACNPGAIHTTATQYIEHYPDADFDLIHHRLWRLHNIRNHEVGIIELNDDLSLDTVATIFHLVNQKGVRLKEADFVMSKLAADQHFNGGTLRKAIDYFCHLFQDHTLYQKIPKSDKSFASTELYKRMAWLGRKPKDYIYKPEHGDVLRIAFTSEQNRPKLQHLVSQLSGRNPETKAEDPAVARKAFASLENGLYKIFSHDHFAELMAILHSAGFVNSGMIQSQTALSFAYILYLRGRDQKVPQPQLESVVRRWFVMSLLKDLHSGSFEARFDKDIQQIVQLGLIEHCDQVIDHQELTPSYWTSALPAFLVNAHRNSRYKRILLAAQVKSRHQAFLSPDISVESLIGENLEYHHIYPRNFLKKEGISANVDSISNMVIAQPGINRIIGDSPPKTYFAVLQKQCTGTAKEHYGGITDETAMRRNFEMNGIPSAMLTTVPSFPDFLNSRAKLLADSIKSYFDQL